MKDSLLLVVEDDRTIGPALSRVLEAHRAIVSLATSGSESLTQATTGVDMVVLDLGLSDMDGRDLCRQLRAGRPDLQILIVTARGQEIEIVVGLDTGADDHLVGRSEARQLATPVTNLPAAMDRSVKAISTFGSGPAPIFSLILPAERRPDVVAGLRGVEPGSTSAVQ
jgi:DNA-binding response OmpR family regulator